MRASFLAGLLILCGCVKHPPILPGTQFRIADFRGQALTLPPPVEQMAEDKPLTVQFPVTLGKAKQACVEVSPLFQIRIDRKTRQLSLTMPSMQRWARPDNHDIEQEIDEIFQTPAALEQRGCLSSGSALQLRQVLRTAVPIRPGYDMYPSYGYRPGSLGLDLKPGTRLKVQRAHFEGTGRTIKDLIGTSTAYSECRLDSHQRLTFAPPTIEYDSEKLKAQPPAYSFQMPPLPIYRLFFLTSFLKKGLRRSALVLGAPSVARMQAMERQIAANPAVACEDLGPACVSFEGDVSVSAEVQVIINGKPTYVDWASTVRSVLRKMKAEQATDIRLRRVFQGKLLPFAVDAKLPDALGNTTLVAGDDLSYRL